MARFTRRNGDRITKNTQLYYFTRLPSIKMSSQNDDIYLLGKALRVHCPKNLRFLFSDLTAMD